MEDYSGDDDAIGFGEEPSSDEESEASTVRANDHSMASTYRRPSYVAYGVGRSTVTPQLGEGSYDHLTKKERREIRNQEQSLLRDNYLAPPKHVDQPPRSRFVKLWKSFFGTRRPKDEEAADIVSVLPAEPSETSALLGNGETSRNRHERENRIWEEAVAAGKIKTTWQREAKTLVQYSSPLIVTFLLQYSLTVASIFTVGHIGKIELGAVSCKYFFMAGSTYHIPLK